MPNISQLRSQRVKKLDALKEAGIQPYPLSSGRDTLAYDFLQEFDELLHSKKTVTLAGRIKSLRAHGKIAFIDLEDFSGRVQLFLTHEHTQQLQLFLDSLDEGDIIEAKGQAYLSQTEQKSLAVQTLRILSKALLPQPQEWYGLQDQEERLRKRYLDMLTDKQVKELFLKKAAFWKSMREFLQSQGFIEVETPVLESSPGGADAKPFLTHLDALDLDLYLRISPELYLKRLIVGGFEKIFEIGRIFRNEGIDKEHLQDYTQLEFYWAFADQQMLMELVKSFYRNVIKATLGSLSHQGNDHVIDWGKEWQIYDYYALMQEHADINLHEATQKLLFAKAQNLQLHPESHLGKGRLIDLIFKKTVRPKLIEPGFLLNPPVEIEPLAKRLENDPGRVARLQIIACGTELGKGYAELNDPLDQRKRMEEQLALRQAGDNEAQRLDEDFIEALEYGMPPTAGFGVSERLFAVLVNKPVREITLFPLMRPKS